MGGGRNAGRRGGVVVLAHDVVMAVRAGEGWREAVKRVVKRGSGMRGCDG